MSPGAFCGIVRVECYPLLGKELAMLCKVRSLGLQGISGYEVTAECDLAGGLPNFDIVGLPDTAVKEARERVKAAVKNSGFRFPDTHITVNLAPADLKKDGAGLDLPIALGVLAAKKYVKLPDPMPVFAGELALDGSLRPVNGILPMILRARDEGLPAILSLPATLLKGNWWTGSRCIQRTTWGRSWTISRESSLWSLWPKRCWNWRNPWRIPWTLQMSRARKWPSGPWRSLRREATMC